MAQAIAYIPPPFLAEDTHEVQCNKMFSLDSLHQCLLMNMKPLV